MIDLRQRHREPELMDQPGVDPRAHRQALEGLRRINRFSRTAHHIWKPLLEWSVHHPLPKMYVLDLACGGGDVVLRIAQWAQRAGLSIEFIGWDISPTAIDQANRAAQQLRLRNVVFEVHDVLADPIASGQFDVIYSTLFLHHLSDDDAKDLLKKMSVAAGHLVIVDDLLRTRLGYWLAWYGGRLLSRSKLVHVDGPLSVRAAFTMDELKEMSNRVGMVGGKLKYHWPERCSLIWERL